jgi:hypothetical protein
VGGGKKCRSFMEMIKAREFTFFDIYLKGFSDINPNAEGFLMAKKIHNRRFQRPLY